MAKFEYAGATREGIAPAQACKVWFRPGQLRQQLEPRNKRAYGIEDWAETVRQPYGRHQDYADGRTVDEASAR